MNMIQALGERFGEHRIEKRANPMHPDQELIFMYLELQIPMTVISTANLSDYKMPVTDKWVGREYNEIFFCLPSYWDLDDIQNPNSNWMYDWLFRLENFVREKNTWFGPGHSIPCGNPPMPLSNIMNQNQLMFLDPIYLEEALRPVVLGDKKVHFLAVVPVFADELDYKTVKGTLKFIRRFVSKKNDERIEEYRKSIMASRFRMF